MSYLEINNQAFEQLLKTSKTLSTDSELVNLTGMGIHSNITAVVAEKLTEISLTLNEFLIYIKKEQKND